MNSYKLSGEYRNILIPLGIVLFASGIFSFGDAFGNLARLIFMTGTIFLVYKYLVMIHTVVIFEQDSVLIKGLLRKAEISAKDIQRIEDHDLFIRVIHPKGAFIIICLFKYFRDLKGDLFSLNPLAEYVTYEKINENEARRDNVFFDFIKLLFELFRWL